FDHPHDEPFDRVPVPKAYATTQKTVAVEIRGTSLGKLYDGWLAYYDDVTRPVTEALFGRLCVVGLADGRVLVKQIRPAKAKGLFHFYSEAEDPILDVELRWAAPVEALAPKPHGRHRTR